MFASIIGIVAYVLGALGFYSIASRRGIHHAWLAWVPIGNLWLLGCISDQYQSIAKGNVRNKRKVMLGLGIAYLVCIIVIVAVCISMFAQLFAMGGFIPEDEGIYSEDIYIEDLYEDLYWELPAELLGSALAMAGASVVLCLAAIPMLVVQYLALYDLFVSCDPGNAVLFLLLSIFLGISSFLVFACKDKDLGMPRPTWQTPYDQPPAYTGYQQPPVEPWEQKTEE